MTSKSATHPQLASGRRPNPERRARDARRAVAQARNAQQQRRQLLLFAIVITAAAALIGWMMWTARDGTDAASRPAPDFTLTDTNGATVHLADYRGKNVVLYFSEGAGCQSCLYQMAEIEQRAADFTAANIVVLPIVMNTAEQIRADMAANGVRTPFLIDTDGSVSTAYGTIGKGMHEGLPGHSFVLIDTNGIQRWYGEYPSMYLSAGDLLKQVREHLPEA